MSSTSGETISAFRFMRPTAQPQKPALRFGPERNDDYSYVVDAAAFIRELDKLFRGALWNRFRLKGSSDFGLGDHARQSVGAKQQNIARKKSNLFHVHFDLRLSAERPKQNALQVALFRFGRCEKSTSHLFSDKRVIACELLKLPGTEQINAAITDMANAELSAIDPRGC